MIYHVSILRKIVDYSPIGGQFKKRNRGKTFFLFILNISNTSGLEGRSMALQEKIILNAQI